jgi:hypothetical protein
MAHVVPRHRTLPAHIAALGHSKPYQSFFRRVTAIAGTGQKCVRHKPQTTPAPQVRGRNLRSLPRAGSTRNTACSVEGTRSA